MPKDGSSTRGRRVMRDRILKTDQNGAANYLLAIACLLFLFGLVAQIVRAGKSSAFDRNIILAFRDPGDPSVPIGPAWIQEAARDLTSLGSIVVLATITAAFAGYLFLARKQAAAWLMLFAVFGGIALSDLLKLAFARPRPDFVAPAARVFTTSFPSGHATLSAITYLTIAALLAQSQSSSRIGRYFVIVAALLTILIGISRVYLGVHYPTDVLGGWCVGTAWALGCWLLMTWLQRGERVEAAGPP
jgi:undecaprenyl-diphosphatase